MEVVEAAQSIKEEELKRLSVRRVTSRQTMLVRVALSMETHAIVSFE